MSTTTVTMRHDPVVESYHQIFLQQVWTESYTALAANPYAACTFEDDVQEAFLGLGYTISNFASLYDMFGKFLAGFDVEAIWEILSPTEIGAFIAEQVERLDLVIDTKILPTFQLEMRTANAVMTSSFVLGKSLVEDKRLKQRSEIALEASASLFKVSDDKMQKVMNWNLTVIKSYAKTMRDFFSTKMTTDDARYGLLVKNLLWPFEVLDYQRKAVAAFHPVSAQSIKTETQATKSPVVQALGVVGWTITGAYIGSEITPGWGTAIGAIVGFIIGIAILLLED